MRSRPTAAGRSAVAAALALAAVAALAAAPAARAQSAVTRGAAITIPRVDGPIAVDGDLSDAAWADAVVVDDWLETNPGDNQPARVGNVARLAYDDRFLYAAFELADPEPAAIRAPLGDRDHVPSYTDYAGVILDTRNDGKSAVMMLANPRGVQYDAISSDASGEDSSPDFFWDSAGRITERGWTLEMRIPFSSLRYEGTSPEWGILLYRNWPRDFRTQMFAGPLPRGENCFICHSHPLHGLTGLPAGGSVVAAPFATAVQRGQPRAGLGSDLDTDRARADGGLDVKWVPTPDLALDATWNPDFSQVEADVPQITANERQALFFPEKRPFFLEGSDLFSTPIQAVYSRSVADPAWGARATGRLGDTSYALLVAEDDGGGSLILPRAASSELVFADFRSTVVLARLRHDLGRSFVSWVTTARESEGGAYNRVFGPDLQWRPTAQDSVTFQLLYSVSQTPDRPELAAEWDGRELGGHAGRLSWSHSTAKNDWFVGYWDYGDEFRADAGFVPTAGFREAFAEIGRTFRPESGPVRRLRTFLFGDYTADRDGDVQFQGISPGFGLDGKWNSFLRFNVEFDRERSGERLFDTEKLFYTVRLSPSRRFSLIELTGNWGDQVDFANHRPADGGTVRLTATVRPSDHLELTANADRRQLDVDEAAARGRLFTADVARLRAQYTFTARSYLRLIGQWVETDRDPSLYTFAVPRRSAGFGGSALLAYKLNWQTVLFLGYSDQRALLLADERRDDRLEPAGREVFLKLSYAFQR
jgi:hypothetical protein